MKTRILIVVEGGLVQGVFACEDSVQVEVLDIDNIRAGDENNVPGDFLKLRDKGIQVY